MKILNPELILKSLQATSLPALVAAAESVNFRSILSILSFARLGCVTVSNTCELERSQKWWMAILCHALSDVGTKICGI
jgi:hypothetical protein